MTEFRLHPIYDDGHAYDGTRWWRTAMLRRETWDNDVSMAEKIARQYFDMYSNESYAQVLVEMRENSESPVVQVKVTIEVVTEYDGEVVEFKP